MTRQTRATNGTVSRALASASRRLPVHAPRIATERFERSAARVGGADVAFAVVDSPLGDLLVASTSVGLVCLAYRRPTDSVDDAVDGILALVARRVSPRIVELPRRLDRVRRELDQYFEGERRSFDLAIDWSLSDGFRRRVLESTATIPYGRVATYRDVARSAGNEAAVRAAGNAVGANPVAIVVPCHRVVRTGGGLGGYGGGVARKEFLLRLEGARLGR